MESEYRDFISNSIAGLINASEAVLMSMIVTRYGRLSDAGILSLSFAVGNVLMSVGKFGGRMYQVTDARKQYSFGMYIIQKGCTIALMMLLLVLLLACGHYPREKCCSIALISIIFAFEAVEESFWGLYQFYNRLYVGAMMFSLRWIIIILAFSIKMIISHDMVISLAYGAAAGAAVFILWLIFFPQKPDFKWFEAENARGNHDISWLKDLFIQTTPLFFASFCSIFISNLPKFVIDMHLNDEIQACYGFVAMPVFVIGMLNQFIYQPTVVKLTHEYHMGEINLFRSNVRKQVLTVTVIALACVAGAGIFGVPVLSAIYHTDLSAYWKELVILQFAGGFLALSGYFNILLTLMRKQNVIFAGYAIVLVVGIFILNGAVTYAGTIGTSVGYAVLMCMLFLFFLIFYLRIMGEYNRIPSRKKEEI